ncbi:MULTISPECIES: DUF4489 domain-containing protein [Clostridium]|uniref:DUF4489 domain-containing protein n=1 Tax=Clostridium beijerinckii TaxID=1520 RepID=A0AAE5H6D5_CLOBE|nr:MULTISPECIES: DUF4489 domain-containing protein [Clostridium]NSB14789.1 hypothetical protein [Clostridium beijerinckii]OOM24691.1 hypothetical protein CLOBE_37670 [Clostridium beijerinckii]
MNSMSKYHDDHDDCRKEKDLCPTIIRCSTPGAVTLPPATVLGTAFPLTALSLNTSRLKNACVKLEFASNLVATVAFTGTINFQVFKQCRGQSTPVPVGPAFTFNLVALLASETFSFFVCDCGDCCSDDCCTYSVIATVTSAVTVGTLSINNATLGAIATCGTIC